MSVRDLNAHQLSPQRPHITESLENGASIGPFSRLEVLSSYSGSEQRCILSSQFVPQDAVLERYVLWPCVRLSVCHKSEIVSKGINIIQTRITGTVHTSAKARLSSLAISVPPSGESVECRLSKYTVYLGLCPSRR